MNDNMFTREVDYKPFADSRTTVSSTALALTAMGFNGAQVAQARAALISVETQGIRYRINGGSPTASIGHPIASGSDKMLYGRGILRNLRIIAQTGSPVVSITLFR